MQQSFTDKFKKRRIWKTFVAYPAASFVILQAVDFFITKYGLNPKALTFTLIALAGGFIIALLWNWLHGEVGHQSYTKKETASYGVIGIMTLAVAFYFSNKATTDPIVFDKQDTEKDYRLAVLPFESVAGDASMNYLSQGIPENIINRLSQNTSLQLVSKASSFLLSKEEQNTDNVRRSLNANMMLTGKINKLDDNLIVNCQLIDTDSNAQIWGEKVALKVGDVLKIEEQIVTSLLASLPERFKKEQYTSKSWSDNPEAQAHYMKGRALSYGSTQEETELALNHFREAIKIDKDFVAAYVAIANEKQVQAMFATDTKGDIFNEARLAVQTALRLDPKYAEAYTVDAMIKFYQDRDWDAAEASYKKAINLDPNNANALIRYSFFLTTLKRYDEAIAMAEKAVVIDPISISSLHNLGWANLVSGNYLETQKAFSDALEIHPNWIWGYMKRSYTHMYLGDCDLAEDDINKARDLLGDWGSELLESCFIFVYDNCELTEKKNKAIDRYLTRVTKTNYKDPMAMGFVYNAKRDFEESIRWHQIGIEEETNSFYMFTIDNIYPEEILQDPRFKQMKRDLNLPQ